MSKLTKINLLLLTLFLKNENEIVFNTKIQSTYSIKIPTNLNFSRRHTVIEYFVKGDIYGDQKLYVEFTDICSIQNNNCLVNVSIKQDKYYFEYDELQNDYSRFAIKLENEKLNSGYYNSKLIVKIYLQGEDE